MYRAEDEQVRENRRLLYYAMIDAGFTNLPSEWWHYDYGDRFWHIRCASPQSMRVYLRGRKFMDNQKQKKKKSVMDTLSATMVLVLIALLLVFVGYTYLALKNGYTLDDLIDNIVGNLIGVLAAFLLFDILNNKLTQDAYARETSRRNHQDADGRAGDPGFFQR